MSDWVVGCAKKQQKFKTTQKNVKNEKKLKLKTERNHIKSKTKNTKN